MDSKQAKIQKLKDYFEKRDDVVMAFLFGSQAKGYARKTSDWDIGVYVKEEDRSIEHVIWRDVEDIVASEVDLVILNRAPATLVWSATRAGTPLAINDRHKYIDILLRSSFEANAWYQTVRKYHQIFERSASLSEEDRARLIRTVEFLEQEIKEFDKFRAFTWKEYTDESSKTKKREIERWAEQLINAIITATEIILASRRNVIPETYRRMTLALKTIPSFDEGDLSERLSDLPELRNVLAHEYLDYRWKEIRQFLDTTEPLWHEFIGKLKHFLKTEE